MKIVKLLLITTLLTYTAVNVANADGFTVQKTVKRAYNISLNNALKDPGLVASMRQQLNIHILYFYMGPSLTVEVYYQKNTYHITGTREQWLEFFHTQGKSIYPANTN
jgi:hypothetical protein